MQGKRFSGEERRKQIMEASLNLFAAKGFNGTRTKDIAERIGTSETLIFQHFSTKEELYYAVLKEFFAGHPIQPDIEDEIACRDDWGFFYNFAKHLLIHMSKDPRIIRLAIYRTLEGSHPDELANNLKDKKTPGLYETLCEYIEKRIAEGAFKPVNTNVYGQIFMEALLMHVLNKELKIMTSLAPVDDEQIAAALADIFLSAVKIQL